MAGFLSVLGDKAGAYVGSTTLSSGSATVGLSAKFYSIEGALVTSNTAATATGVTISGTTLTILGGTSDVVTYLVFGKAKL